MKLSSERTPGDTLAKVPEKTQVLVLGLRDLVIVGAGGHAREVLDAVEAINAVAPSYRFIGFLADGERFPERAHARGAPILGGVDLLEQIDAPYIIAIGNPKARREIAERASRFNRTAEILVDPRATLGSQLALQPGCYVAAGAVLTTNITLGRHSHVNVGASVSHDAVMGDWCSIGPGARLAGNVQLGDGVDLGIGALIRPGVTIGSWSVVGAGAVVVNDLPGGVTAVGNPASPL